MSFGVTDTGFRHKRLPEILEELHAGLRAEFGQDLNLEADAVLGQLAGVFARARAHVRELMAAVWHAQYRRGADDVHLDALGELLGIARGENEDDASYRRRIRRRPGDQLHSTAAALRTQLLATVGVTSATMLTSQDAPPSGEQEAYEVPDHHFEAVVEGGSAAAVAQTIWKARPAGVFLHHPDGFVEEFAFDSEGVPHRVTFSRPHERLIRVGVRVLKPGSEESGSLPAGWADVIRSGILALGNGHGTGEAVVVQRFFEPALAVPGIIEVQLVFTEDGDPETVHWDSETPGEGDAVIDIGPGEKAVFQVEEVTFDALGI